MANSAPKTFKTGTMISVEDGMTLDQISSELKEDGYIRSKLLLKFAAKFIFLKEKGAVAGEYVFDTRLTTLGVTRRILTGDFNLNPIKVTIPEGLNKFDIAKLLVDRIPNFDSEKFLSITHEGYLFPDTYFFLPNVTPEKVMDIMEENFTTRVEPLMDDIENSGRTLQEIVTMASIVELEARVFETRQIVADILWRRFDTHMPLQVDVSFKYINGKTTKDITVDDLEIDSPYNSYKYKGLPPTAISNPGLDSIRATLNPTKTDYLFFLTDKEGIMHYTKTFEEHMANIKKYLR